MLDIEPSLEESIIFFSSLRNNKGNPSLDHINPDEAGIEREKICVSITSIQPKPETGEATPHENVTKENAVSIPGIRPKPDRQPPNHR